MQRSEMVKIDTEIAAAYRDLMAANEDQINLAKQIQFFYLRKGTGTQTEDVHGYVQDLIASGIDPSTNPRGIDPSTDPRLSRYMQLDRTVDSLLEAYHIKNAAYLGWSRFYAVPGGHIHSSMGCSTCNNGQFPTVFMWLPELSGLTEVDAVKEHGPALCTVCFPSAPTRFTTGTFRAKNEGDAVCPGSGTTQWTSYRPRNGRTALGQCGVCGKHTTSRSEIDQRIRKHTREA